MLKDQIYRSGYILPAIEDNIILSLQRNTCHATPTPPASLHEHHQSRYTNTTCHATPTPPVTLHQHHMPRYTSNLRNMTTFLQKLEFYSQNYSSIVRIRITNFEVYVIRKIIYLIFEISYINYTKYKRTRSTLPRSQLFCLQFLGL